MQIVKFEPKKITPYEHLSHPVVFFGFATRGCVRRPNVPERLAKYSENAHTAFLNAERVWRDFRNLWRPDATVVSDDI